MRRRANLIALALVPIMLTPRAARAQFGIQSFGNGVTVTTVPAADPNREKNSGPYPVTYTVTNNSGGQQGLTFTCSVTGPLTCANVNPTTAILPSGQSIPVSLTYSTTNTTGSGGVTLTATLDDGTPPTSSGSRSVTVANTGSGVITLRVPNQDNLDRGLCLTVGAGEAAGLSCGDLMVTHSLPAYRSLGRDRTLTLYYNSATGTGLNLVTARIAEPATIATPATIRVLLTVNGVYKDSTVYTPPGSSSCGFVGCADTFQVSVGRNLSWSSLGTGYYPYTLMLRNVFNGSALRDTTVSGQLLVINRSGSEYGQGWGLLGVEQILAIPSDTSKRLWVSGDGSARVYARGVQLTSASLTSSGMQLWNAANVVDLVTTNTGWQTTSSTTTSAYVRKDFGAATPREVTYLQMHTSVGGAVTYTVEYSANGTAWSTAVSSFEPEAGWTYLTWPTKGAQRYWRLRVVGTSATTTQVHELSFGSQTAFYGAPGDAPDSLVQYAGTGGSWYRRDLKHGARVDFDAGGQHRTTTNRVGAVTSFYWGGSPTRLDSVNVPPAVAPRRTYRLFWNATTHLLDSIRDPGGRRLRTVMSSGRLVKVVEPGNLDSTRFAYDARGVLNKRIATRQHLSTKGDSAVTTYSYANNARVTQIAVQADSAGAQNAVTGVTPWDEYGLSALVLVDTAGPATRLDGPISGTGDAVDFWVDPYGQLKRSQQIGLGTITRLWHDRSELPGLVTRIAFPHPNIVGDSGRVAIMVWNSRGNLLSQTEKTSHVKRSLSDQTSIGFADRVTTYAYSDANAPDAPTLVTGPDGLATRYRYNGMGLTDSVVDPRGLATKFLYDSGGSSPYRGVVLSVKDGTTTGTSATRSFTYNADGNIQTAKSAIGATTSFESDNLGRIIAVYDPYGSKTGYTVDALNRVTRSELFKAHFNHPTEPSPLPPGHLADGDEPLDSSWPTSLPTTYARSGGSALDSVIDPRNVARRFRYDARGLVKQEIDDSGRAKTSYYSVSGLLDSTRMRNGSVIRNAYDAEGRRTYMYVPARVISMHDFPETYDEKLQSGCCTRIDTMPGDTVHFTYNLLGAVIATSNRWGTISRSYYADGALETRKTDLIMVNPFGTPSPGILDSLHYSYDASGRVSQLNMASEKGRYYDWEDTVHYAYNAQGDLSTESACFGKGANWSAGAIPPPCRTFTFTWDSLGRRKSITYPNTAVVTYTYDLQDVLTGVTGHKTAQAYEPPANKTDRFDFTYSVGNVNAVGHIQSQWYACQEYAIQDPGGVPCGENGTTRQVTNVYNKRGDLLRQTSYEGSVFRGDTTGFDYSGNLLRRAKWDGGQPQWYTVDDFTMPALTNRLTASTRSDTTHTPYALTYEYDADGARLAQRVTPVTNSTIDKEQRWYYDALGRQTGYKYVEWISSEPLTRNEPVNGCWYDPEGNPYRPCNYGAQLVAYEGHNVSRFGNGGFRFIHGPGTDEVLMARYYPGSGVLVNEAYFVTDGQGRQLASADSNGTRDAAIWGAGGVDESGTLANGSSFDAARIAVPNQPGVSLFRNRAYDANSGRWLQEDPIGLAGGLNLYQFTGNNPVTFTDPFGLSADSVVYADAGLKAVFQDLRKESATFDRMLTTLENSSVTTTVELGSASDGPGHVTTNLLSRLGFGLSSQTISINPSAVAQLRAQAAYPIDVKDVSGHEVGHAAANVRQGRSNACPDRGSQPSCSVQVENAVRRERQRPPRPVYWP